MSAQSTLLVVNSLVVIFVRSNPFLWKRDLYATLVKNCSEIARSYFLDTVVLFLVLLQADLTVINLP